MRVCQESMDPQRAAEDPEPASSLAADQVAGMVGLSVAEVSDLLGSSHGGSNSGLAGGTAIASHISQLLHRLDTSISTTSAGTLLRGTVPRETPSIV